MNFREDSRFSCFYQEGLFQAHSNLASARRPTTARGRAPAVSELTGDQQEEEVYFEESSSGEEEEADEAKHPQYGIRGGKRKFPAGSR